MAPAEMPRVIPPMPKYSTINMTLKSPVDIPNEFAIPDNTPPSILSFKFLYISTVFAIQFTLFSV